MKRILFILISVVLLGTTSSCIVSKPYSEHSTTLFYDEFEDFFITESNSVSFDYDPIGSVSSLIESGNVKRKYREATPTDAIYVLYNEAKKNGANGIINLKISYSWNFDKEGNVMSLKSVSASGMAINKY